MLRFIFTAALVLTSVMLEGQSMTPPSVIGGQKAVAPAAGDEIAIDLIVRDKHGHLVHDLRPGEIRLTDEGVREKITRLNLVTGARSTLVSLVFDGLDAVSGRLARDGAMEMLGASPADVRFSVWKIHDRLTLLQDFTTDRDAIRRAAEAATSAATRSASRSEPAPSSAADPGSMGEQVGSASDRLMRDEHFHPCLSRLLAVTRRLGTYPGRKTLLYFSDGVDMTAAAPDQLWSVIGSANNAGVSIYALDVSGLTKAAKIAAYGAPSPVADGKDAEPEIQALSNGLLPPAVAKAAAEATKTAQGTPKDDYRSPLKKLAETTGGFYFDEANDPHVHIDRIAEDISAHYEATYLRPPSEADGRFRAVSVRINRRDASVQARAGYFALPGRAGTDLRPFEVPLLNALNRSERTASFPFNSRVLRFGWKGEKARAELALEIPLNAFECVENKDARACRSHISILALVRDWNGGIVQKFSLDRPYQMNAARFAETQKEVFTFQRAFEVPPGEYQVDVAVADRLGKKLSAKSAALSIPPKSAGVLLSDLALVRRLEPLSPLAEGEALEYLRKLIIPDLSAEWPQDDRNVPLFITVYPAAGSDKPRLELELTRGGATVAKFPATLSEARAGDPVPFVAALKGSALTPGSYQLKARATQASTASEQTLSFTVTARGALEQNQSSASAEGSAFESGPELLRNLLKPTDAEVKRILEAARQRALAYKEDLTNFACIEVTRRTADRSGSGDWKPKDSITEVLQYIDGSESAQLLEVNGNRETGQRDTTSGRVFGEFASLFDLVFSQHADARIEWQDVADWKGSMVNVFRYRVPAERSRYRLTARNGGKTMLAAYKGLVYIDTNTMAVRRISVEASGIPKEFPIYRSDMTVDYDWVQISGHEYLLPQLTTLFVGTGKRSLIKTEKEFRDYRRYEVGADWKGTATP